MAYSDPIPLAVQLPENSAHLKIQVASDLHTEFYDSFSRVPEDIIVPRDPVLALVGDIGLAMTDLLRQFLHHQAERFEHVLFVAGNHEFYNACGKKHTFDEQMDWMRHVCNEKENLHFLEHQAVKINNEVVVLGTTLWSWIPPSTEFEAAITMNDYQICYWKNEPKNLGKLQPKHTNAKFEESVAWLQEQMEHYRNQGKPVVVLTHHVPSREETSAPIYKDSELNCCFASDLRHLFKPPVVAWACGHTHFNFDQTFDHHNTDNACDSTAAAIKSTRLVSNQRGYPGGENKDYDKEGLILRVPLPQTGS